MTVQSGAEGTSYYSCDICLRSCDPQSTDIIKVSDSPHIVAPVTTVKIDIEKMNASPTTTGSHTYPTTPTDTAIDELDESFSNYLGGTPDSDEYADWLEFKQAIEAIIQEREKLVARKVIRLIDDMHFSTSGNEDRTFKGIKNTIRDRYKADYGYDPTPGYPIEEQFEIRKQSS
jgi:hypothetical protein